MSLPVLVLTGALGAGKTTLINRLLTGAHGRRIAAIVNDFGSINIDAELIAGQTEEILGLRNGCICCSLQGDLLRSLKTLLDRDPPPELIVVEASGVSDPAGIIETLYDPLLFGHVTVEAVVCVVDAQAITDDVAVTRDPLWQAQVAGADLLVLSKATGLGEAERLRLRALLAAQGKSRLYDPDRDAEELELLLLAPETMQSDAAQRLAGVPRAAVTADRFATLEWTREGALSMPRFQAAIQALSPGLLRAKGFIDSADHPGTPLLFQLVGRRATVERADPATAPGCRLVLIGRAAEFDPEKACSLLEGC